VSRLKEPPDELVFQEKKLIHSAALISVKNSGAVPENFSRSSSIAHPVREGWNFSPSPIPESFLWSPNSCTVTKGGALNGLSLCERVFVSRFPLVEEPAH
jgi:hypothetical protein